MIRSRLLIPVLAVATAFISVQASAKNCAKLYNDCRNTLFSDRKTCVKKRDKCDAENAQAEVAVTQNSTKNRMLNGEARPKNGMRGWSSAEGEQDSVEAKKAAARKRIMERENESAQAPQKSNMRDNVNSN